jgi:hypothetical protein
MASASIHAQNYLKILGVINRTILPRRILLANGTARLSLLAARQCATLDEAGGDPEAGSLDHLAGSLAHLCAKDFPVTYKVEPLAVPVADFTGFPAIAIVNAQHSPGEPRAVPDPKIYRFAKSGWPLSAPANATFASLAAAARIAWAISGWQGLQDEKMPPPTLILAISDALKDELSVSVEGEVTITSTPPASLGRLVAGWRNRS